MNDFIDVDHHYQVLATPPESRVYADPVRMDPPPYPLPSRAARKRKFAPLNEYGMTNLDSGLSMKFDVNTTGDAPPPDIEQTLGLTGLKNGDDDKTQVNAGQIAQVKEYAYSHPTVFRAMSVIVSRLKNYGVQVFVDSEPIDPKKNDEFNVVYKKFIERAIFSYHAVGYCIFKIVPVHDSRRLVAVPVVQDFWDYEVRFNRLTVSNENQYYVYDAEGNHLEDMLVKAVFHPDADGNLTSPLFKIVPHIMNVAFYSQGELQHTDNSLTSPYVIGREETRQEIEQQILAKLIAELNGTVPPGTLTGSRFSQIGTQLQNFTGGSRGNGNRLLAGSMLNALGNKGQFMPGAGASPFARSTDRMLSYLRTNNLPFSAVTSMETMDPSTAPFQVTWNPSLQHTMMKMTQGWGVKSQPTVSAFPVNVQQKVDGLSAIVASFCQIPRFFLQENDSSSNRSRHSSDVRLYQNDLVITVKEWDDRIQEFVDELTFHIYIRAPRLTRHAEGDRTRKGERGVLPKPLTNIEVAKQWKESIEKLRDQKHGPKKLERGMETQREIAEDIQSWTVTDEEKRALELLQNETEVYEEKGSDGKKAPVGTGEDVHPIDVLRERLIEEEGFGVFVGVKIRLLWVDKVFIPMEESGMFVDPLNEDTTQLQAWNQKQQQKVKKKKTKGKSGVQGLTPQQRKLLEQILSKDEEEAQGTNPLEDQLFSDMDLLGKKDGGQGDSTLDHQRVPGQFELLAGSRDYRPWSLTGDIMWGEDGRDRGRAPDASYDPLKGSGGGGSGGDGATQPVSDEFLLRFQSGIEDLEHEIRQAENQTVEAGVRRSAMQARVNRLSEAARTASTDRQAELLSARDSAVKDMKDARKRELGWSGHKSTLEKLRDQRVKQLATFRKARQPGSSGVAANSSGGGGPSSGDVDSSSSGDASGGAGEGASNTPPAASSPDNESAPGHDPSRADTSDRKYDDTAEDTRVREWQTLVQNALDDARNTNEKESMTALINKLTGALNEARTALRTAKLQVQSSVGLSHGTDREAVNDEREEIRGEGKQTIEIMNHRVRALLLFIEQLKQETGAY